MPQLYQLTEDLLQLYESLSTDEDGAIDEELARRLGELSEHREDSLVWLAKIAKSLESDADAYATHLDYLRRRQRQVSDRFERLRKYILENMERLGEAKIVRDGITIRVQRNSQPTVCVPFVDKLPEDFIRYRDPEPDKEKILREYKAGREVEGAEVIVGNHLRIV
jgi:hypothetical protein